jgi:hypothetical protein
VARGFLARALGLRLRLGLGRRVGSGCGCRCARFGAAALGRLLLACGAWIRGIGSGSRGTRAEQGVRPTSCLGERWVRRWVRFRRGKRLGFLRFGVRHGFGRQPVAEGPEARELLVGAATEALGLGLIAEEQSEASCVMRQLDIRPDQLPRGAAIARDSSVGTTACGLPSVCAGRASGSSPVDPRGGSGGIWCPPARRPRFKAALPI